jgi:hypothetical protein
MEGKSAMADNGGEIHSGSKEQPSATVAAAEARADSVIRPSRGWAALRWLLLWCVLLAALAGLRSHTFLAPIAHDEAIFLYGGQAWAAGQTPYRGFWDHKAPNIFLFHSLPLRLFPFSRPAALVHELLWLALAATFLAAVCRLYLSRTATFAALVFFCLFVSERVTVRTGGLTEESSLTFVALSYLMILRPSRGVWRDAFWAGVFLGFAAQFRQTFACSLPFLLAAAAWRSRRAGLNARSAAAAMALGLVGFAAPEAFWSAYFALRGVWREYFEGSYLFNFFYVLADRESQMTLADSLHEHWRVLRDTGPMLAAPALALPMSPWLPRGRRAILGLLVLAFAGEFAPVLISGEYYHHYYIQAAVSSCLLLGVTIEAIRGIVMGKTDGPAEARPDGAKRVIRLAVGLAVAATVIAAAAWLTVGGVRVYVEQYRSVIRRNRSPVGDLAIEKSLGAVLDQLTTPDETILMLGVQPNACYFAARRYAGARYFHNSPLFKGKFQKHISAAMQQRMLADLKTRRPTLILLGTLEGGEREWLGLGLLDRRAGFLRPYLDANYAPLEQVVSQIPRDWFWYQRDCSFLVRNDQIETLRKRLAALRK